jgi:hypothetical protein
MGIACAIAGYYIKFTLQWNFFSQLVLFIGVILGATLLYVGLTWAFRCPEVEEVYGIAMRRPSAAEGFAGA